MSNPNDLEAVAALLRERDALRGWLDRLGSSGASVPDAVRVKVREDYQTRLDGLIDQLRLHADVVASRLREDQQEHDHLRDQARAVREALAEAELRHAVGEYDAARFDTERARYVGELERYEQELDAVAERIAGLEDVHLAVLREPDAASTDAPVDFLSEPEADTDASFTLEVEEVVAEVEVAEDLEFEALAPVEETPSETDDLLSIFDLAESPPSPPRGEPEMHPPVVPRPQGFGPLSFTPHTPSAAPPGGGRPARPAVPSLTPPLGMPGSDQSPRFVRPAPERGSELVEAPAEPGERLRVTPDPEPVLPEVSPEAPETGARTLRCGECGAMNRPLEWYCEKCGAELTAV